MTETDSPPSPGLPPWDIAELPEPRPLGLRNWASFIGPGIVMMGIQIGGGEWLLGPSITAKYGGGLMWLATVAIIVVALRSSTARHHALATVLTATAAADATTALRQSMSDRSGVIMDTELSRLISLQNAYTANARVITTMQSLWSQLQQMLQ